jgi:hypothetical protein
MPLPVPLLRTDNNNGPAAIFHNGLRTASPRCINKFIEFCLCLNTRSR